MTTTGIHNTGYSYFPVSKLMTWNIQGSEYVRAILLFILNTHDALIALENKLVGYADDAAIIAVVSTRTWD
ncbi:hypothetical protein SK128_019066 [Halocaridina rubra]|uniref:Uncharacterized protein n=1 Tax=Halocaridina rubra TaxID=373956 RepID=A0AAN8XF78_HALRR